MGPGLSISVHSGGGGSVPLALDYVDSSAVLQYVDARLDVAHVAGRMSAWGDQHTGALHYTQGTGANQPLYNETGGPNGEPYVSLDSVARYMASSLALPIPSTTPTMMWFIARQVTWTSGRRILSDTTNLKRLVFQDGSTPQVDIYDGAAVGDNDGGTLGSFARFHAHWAVAASRLDIGAVNKTSLNPSAQAADVGRLIGNSAGSTAVVDLCVLLHMNRALTAQEESDLDTVFIPSRFGASVLV